jgi:hypothetical protein
MAYEASVRHAFVVRRQQRARPMSDLVVRPRPGPDANPKVVRKSAYLHHFRLVSDSEGVAVVDAKERRHAFPPEAGILARIRVEEDTGGFGVTGSWEAKYLLLADAEHRVLWKSNGDSFDPLELSEFDSAVGLSFETDAFLSENVEKTYPGYEKAIWIAWNTSGCGPKTAIVLAAVPVALAGVARAARW